MQVVREKKEGLQANYLRRLYAFLKWLWSKNEPFPDLTAVTGNSCWCLTGKVCNPKPLDQDGFYVYSLGAQPGSAYHDGAIVTQV